MFRTVVEPSLLEVFERHVLLGTWFSGGLANVQLMVGFNDLKCISQPKLSYSTILWK